MFSGYFRENITPPPAMGCCYRALFIGADNNSPTHYQHLKNQILTTPLEIQARLRLNPNIEIRWPHTHPRRGCRVFCEGHPHPQPHEYGNYWLGSNRAEDGSWHFIADLFDEQGNFFSVAYTRENFVLPHPISDEEARQRIERIAYLSGPAFTWPDHYRNKRGKISRALKSIEKLQAKLEERGEIPPDIKEELYRFTSRAKSALS